MLNYLTDQLLDRRETNINERVKYTANTGMVLINTANANLDGTGTLTTVLTAASNGTLVKTITIQSIQNTTQGMIRFFIFTPNFYDLIEEIQVQPLTKSGNDPAFSISLDVDFDLKSGYELKVSTEKAESFIITVEGMDYTYP